MTPIRVLLVDDSPTDARLTALWLDESGLVAGTETVPDGETALAWLRREQHELPQLVLLDINLPRCSGFEVLAEIKADRRLAHLPVIMLTGSDAAADAERARALEAQLCLTKPADADGFAVLVEQIEAFWRGQDPAR